MTEESLYYHALALAARGGYHALKKLRGNAARWEDAYRALAEAGAALPDPEPAALALERAGIRLILAPEEEYPEPLRTIAQPPFGIYVRGILPHADAIAVVGTRRASAEGKKIARDFARELAAAGFAIASGLAFGIDAAAHEGALDARAATVAVLAGGLDRVYPGSHEALARRILAGGGALVSEYPPGEDPFSYRFIERNRIISGVSRGALIVEAPESSGALATARYALDQNRDVFVVPGPVASSGYKGSHALIRQGAELVATPKQILEVYGIEPRAATASEASAHSPEETLILRALKAIAAPAEVDKLSEITRLEPRIVNRIISFLIIRGAAKETDAGYILENNHRKPDTKQWS